VTRVERSGCFAVGADGAERLLHATPLPAVGDWIAVAGDTVRHVLPRWSALSRADPGGVGDQTLAANIDLVLITAPADRSSPARVEREVTIAWDSGALPLVVVTKCDLDSQATAQTLAGRLPGVDVLAVSAVTGGGLAALHARLASDQTAVLIGPSGAGKSTLANALLGADTLATGEVRAGDHRGRHTTTSRQLVAIPGGGVLIDTPGLRSLGLPAGIEIGSGFPDVEALAARCRFADCAHEGEPGCAVVEALAGGELELDRLESFRKLAREMAWGRRRNDPLAQRAERQVWKARTKEFRARDKGDGR
jgi:ribosome biogenesis GTPase